RRGDPRAVRSRDRARGRHRGKPPRGRPTRRLVGAVDAMRIDVISIFPEYLAALELSLLGKARDRGLVDLHVHDLRRWPDDVHRTVDDTPYGGGPGMVMRPEPWGRALDEVVPEAGDQPL